MKIIQGNWGYAVVENNSIWIPVINGKMSQILETLYKETGITKMIFSAVLNPEKFKKHLKNIIREWDEWFEEVRSYSHCIEIKYEPHKEVNENYRGEKRKRYVKKKMDSREM